MAEDKDNKIKVSDELIGIEKDEALKYLGLDSDANDYEIDEKFWQLSKRARVIKDDAEREQKMVDLSYVFDVATGKEQARLKALAEREAEPKFLGKTKGEWKNYIGYTWYKYLIVIVAVVCLFFIVKRVIFTPKEDIAVLSVGHFLVDGDNIEARLLDFGFKHPYVADVDLAVPNDQGQTNNAYAETSSSVLFLSNPEIVVTDEATVYYFYGNMDDMTNYYEALKDQLLDQAYEKITPIYYSEYESVELSIKYQEDMGAGNIDYSELETADRTKKLIGLEVKDPEFIEKMGYTNKWPKSEPTLVFSFGIKGDNKKPAEEYLTSLLKELS